MRGSRYIIPISILVHLIIINGTLYVLTPETYFHWVNISYYSVSWLLITYSLNYYPTARQERFLTNIILVLQLYIIFGLSYFAFFTFRHFDYDLLPEQLTIFGLICFFLFLSRALFYYARSKYRLGGGNFVNVVVIGRDKNLKKLRAFFDQPDLGFRYKGYFANAPSPSDTYLGAFKDSLDYILKNDIDQIYCMVSQLEQCELRALINFADNNFKKLQIIPDNKEIFTRGMSIELYGMIPVLNMREIPLEKEYKRALKRTFDIVFSLLVIVLILSWLTPLLFIVMKLDSKGNLFFRQKRHGAKKEEFWCYKFRSMAASADANYQMATFGDSRITPLGKFLRKTSLDELPQFYNVFLGHMSVVGLRPHMVFHSGEFELEVDKYTVRHFVKPGITGLAQIKGYRGEIICKADITNRVRLDIFYVEKWCMLWDIEIILGTVRNMFKGEEKAY